MQQLLPTGHQESPEEALRELALRRGRPWVYASAAMTLDGKINSRRKPLGGPEDQIWYGLAFEMAESVIVGAKNFRSAGPKTRYRDKDIVILSNSLDLPPEAPAFQSDTPVKIFTTSQDSLSVKNENIEYFRNTSWTAEQIIGALGPRRILVDGGGDIYRFFAPVISDWIVCMVPRFAGPRQPAIWPDRHSESSDLDLRWLYWGDQRLFARWTNQEALNSSV